MLFLDSLQLGPNEVCQRNPVSQGGGVAPPLSPFAKWHGITISKFAQKFNPNACCKKMENFYRNKRDIKRFHRLNNFRLHVILYFHNEAPPNWVCAALTYAHPPGWSEIFSYSMSVCTFSHRGSGAMIDPGMLNFDRNYMKRWISIMNKRSSASLEDCRIVRFWIIKRKAFTTSKT